MAFLFATPQEINSYAQLKLVGKLDSNSGTPDVYILDKERNLRGRKKVKIIRRDTVLLVPPN
jgi:hypothetical protein